MFSTLLAASVALSAGVRLASGQAAPLIAPAPTPADVSLAFYEQSGCDGPDFTVITGARDFCHRVPGSTTQSGYRVRCNTDDNGGTFSICTDSACNDCFIDSPFNNYQCLPVTNPAAGIYGGLSLAVSCRPLAPPPQPPFGRCTVVYYEFPGCTGPDRTNVEVNAELCQTVPGDGSWKITPSLDADGSGVLSYCQDPSCSSCAINAPFTPGQCYTNSADTGSASYRVVCGVAPSATPSPAPPSPSASASGSSSPVPSVSATPSASTSATASASRTPSSSSTPAPSRPPSPSASSQPSQSATASSSSVPSASSSPAPSPTSSRSAPASASAAPSQAPKPSASAKPSPSHKPVHKPAPAKVSHHTIVLKKVELEDSSSDSAWPDGYRYNIHLVAPKAKAPAHKKKKAPAHKAARRPVDSSSSSSDSSSSSSWAGYDDSSSSSSAGWYY